MAIRSAIHLTEVVENKVRKFGENLRYAPAIVHRECGAEEPALFTEGEILRAVARAKKNPEDCPVSGKSLWQLLFGD